MSGSSHEPARSARPWVCWQGAFSAPCLVYLALLALTGALAGCGLIVPPPKEPAPRPKPAPLGLESQLGQGPMARVPSGTYGPHLVLTTSGPVVAWAEPLDDGVSWHTLVRGTDTRLRLGPELAKTAGQLSFFKLDRARTGAVLARVTRKDGVDAVVATLLSGKGASVPRVLSAEEGEVLWVASVPDVQGARVLWARRRGGSAEISMAGLDDLGVAGQSELLRKQGVGWQLAEGGAGIWLASLEGSAHKAALMLTRLDVSSGERRSIELAKGLTGADQLDVWVGDARVVVTLREVGSAATRLLMAEVDAAGAVSVPLRPITEPRGTQGLLRLLSRTGSKRPWLAWEEPALDGASWRRVLLARLREGGVASPDAWLDVHDASSLFPSVAEADGALVALTREAPCTEPGCDASESGLALVALGTDASGAQMVTRLSGLPEGLERGSLCWDLDCMGGACALLCAETDTPTSVHFVSVQPGRALERSGVAPSSAGASAGPLHGLSGAPRLLRRDVVMAVAEVSDLALGQGDGKAVLSWVTDFDPTLRPGQPGARAPDGRPEPYQAELHALCLDRAKATPAPSAPSAPSATEAATVRSGPVHVIQDTTVSRRARSLGGVALSGVRSDKRVLGWAALDQGRAHVFVTLLDAQGRKLKQRLLSRNSGEVTDVQVLATPTGFLALWVDDRTGTGQIYAQAIDDQLNSVGPERALTTQAQAPIGLFALLRRGEVILTFADGEGDRSGSIFALSVDAATLEPAVHLRNLSRDSRAAEGSAGAGSAGAGSAATRPPSGHAHSPLLFVGPQSQLGVAFVERRERGDGQSASELFGLRLDDGLRAVGSPTVLVPAAFVSSFAIDCDPHGCHLLAVSPGARRAELWGASSADGVLWRSEFLMSLDGDAQLLPSPVLAGSDAYLAAPSGQDTFNLERLTIDFGSVAP